MKICRPILGACLFAAASMLTFHAAYALNGPTSIQIDGGPLGPLQLSGGVDGYGYYLSGTNSNGHPTGNTPVAANVGSAMIQLQKATGQLQFTLEIGSIGGAIPLGAQNGRIAQTSVKTYVTGPIYKGYVTIAPTDSPITISAGQLGSVEGWESSIDWYNASQLTTDMWYVENSQSRGVSASYTKGPISATVEFGDGFDTGVFNFLQAIATYTINPTNSLTIYGAANLGATGPNTFSYGGGNTGYANNFVNSQMIGGYYNYTIGNLSLVPEVQYVKSKIYHKLGLDTPSSNFGTAVFADYSLGSDSPYSIGGWVEYEKSLGQYFWFIAPRSEAVGIAVSPTWQYKYLFARANLGGLYVLNNTASYGSSGSGKGVFLGTLEAGLLF